jgi:hypothetical protein
VVLLAGSAGRAADNAPPNKPTVRYDYSSGIYSDYLPHGRAFLIEVTSPAYIEINDVYLSLNERCPDVPTGKPLPKRAQTVTGDLRTLTVEVDRLKYDRPYCLNFKVTEGFSPADAAAMARAVAETLEYRSPDPNDPNKGIESELGRALGPLGDRLGLDPKTKQPERVAVILRKWFVPEGGNPTVIRARNAATALRKAQNLAANEFDGIKKALVQSATTIPNKTWPSYPGVRELIAKANEVDSLVFSNGLRGAEATAVDSSASPPALTQAAQQVRARVLELRNAASAVKTDHCDPDLGRLLEESKALDKEVSTVKQAIEAEPDPAKKKNLHDQLNGLSVKLDAARTVHKTRKDLCDSVLNFKGYAEQVVRDLDNQVTSSRVLSEARAEFNHVQAEAMTGLPVSRVSSNRTPLPSYTERAAYYISADFGGAVPIFPGGGASLAIYAGVNFYFDSVDKEVPLAVDDSFGKRFSLMLGMTLNTIQDSRGTTSGIIGGNSVLLGVGFRLTDYIRVGGGVAGFKQRDPNPAVNETHQLRLAPYISASVDLDVVGIVKDAFSRGRQVAQ